MEVLLNDIWLIQAMSIQVKCRRNWSQCPQSLLLLYHLFCPNWHLYFTGVLYNSLRKTKSRPDLQMAQHDVQAPPDSGHLQYYSPFLAIPEKNCEGKSSQNFQHCTQVLIFLGRRNGQRYMDMCLYL